jgi:hypothetical protein
LFKGLLEVNTYLRTNLGQHLRFHARILGLLEEKILGLGKAQVAIHCQCFFRKIDRNVSRWKISDHGQELFKDPSSLLEKFACFFYSISGKVHIAGYARESDSVVV